MKTSSQLERKFLRETPRLPLYFRIAPEIQATSPCNELFGMPKITAVPECRAASPVSTSISTGWDARGALSYSLVAAETLPAITAARTLGVLILGDKWAKRYMAFIRQHAKLWIVLYFLGLVYRIYGMVVPARLSGYWWLLLSPLLQAGSVSSVSLSLRYEFISQLMKSFEFWFFLAVNVMWVVAIFIGYHDSRVVVCLMSMVELENATMADANAQRLEYITPAALLVCIALMVSIVGILVDAIEIQNVVLWTTPRGHVLKLEDFLVNAMATITVLMARVAYRKRDAWRHTDSTAASPAVFSAPPPSVGPETVSTTTHKLLTFQLECAPIKLVFSSVHVLAGHTAAESRPPNWWIRSCWMLLLGGAIAALIALAAALPRGVEETASSSTVNWPVLLTATLTVLAACPFVALYQRQLLRRLFGSFDFLFLLVQVIAASVCVCHIFLWRPQHCTVVSCVSIWYYVVITYDALTPAAKTTLGWTPGKAAVLAAVVLGFHLVLGVQLLFQSDWDIENRVIVHFSLFGHEIQIFAIPFLFSRLMILVIWNCRVLWRLVACSRRLDGELELITLQGAVQYKRRQSTRTAR